MRDCDCLDFCGDDPRLVREPMRGCTYGGQYRPPLSEAQVLLVKDNALSIMLAQLDGTAQKGMPTAALIQLLRQALDTKPGRQHGEGK